MRVLARITIVALAIFTAGCADDSSGWKWSSCDDDAWCDHWGCHEREVCRYESCEKTWDDDFFEDEYVEECIDEWRTTEESRRHDGREEFRRVAIDGEMCRYEVTYNGWDYDETYWCSDYHDEETWRTLCGPAGCRTEHCINGACDWN